MEIREEAYRRSWLVKICPDGEVIQVNAWDLRIAEGGAAIFLDKDGLPILVLRSIRFTEIAVMSQITGYQNAYTELTDKD